MDESTAVINPAYLASVQKELAETRQHRDEWLWCYTQVLFILKAEKGWETAKEFAVFGDQIVPLEGATLAKLARRAIDALKTQQESCKQAKDPVLTP